MKVKNKYPFNYGELYNYILDKNKNYGISYRAKGVNIDYIDLIFNLW